MGSKDGHQGGTVSAAGRVAVDAVGGDHGPGLVVAGAVQAARRFSIPVTLVGPEAEIRAEFDRHETTGLDLSVVHAAEAIGMDEHPAQAARRKPNSSIAVAIREAKEGRAVGMVSAGNSGAVMAVALVLLGRIPGVERPAIASTLPTLRSATLVLDLGAVTDPRPQHMVQFAWMGHVYAERVLGRPSPSIGLLSNGEESSKGNQLVREVYPLLATAEGLRFHGNVEGKDVPLGTVDVVVTDGFTGNVALKVAEGIASLTTQLIRDELTRTWPRKLAAMTLRPAFRAVRNRLDSGEYGGAQLLGVDGTVIIAHGGSSETAIANAIRVAAEAASRDLSATIAATVRRAAEATTQAAADGIQPAP